MKKTIFIQSLIIIALLFICYRVFYLKKIDSDTATKAYIKRLDTNQLILTKTIKDDAEDILDLYEQSDISNLLQLNLNKRIAILNDFENQIQEAINQLEKTLIPLPKMKQPSYSNDIIKYPKLQSIEEVKQTINFDKKLKQDFLILKKEWKKSDLKHIQFIDNEIIKNEVDNLSSQQNNILSQLESGITDYESAKVERLDIHQNILFFKNIKIKISLAKYQLKYDWIPFSAAIYQSKNMQYQIILSPEKMAQVEQPFRADFYLSSYCASFPTKIKVDGKSIPTVNGIGYFDFKGRQLGTNFLRIDIETKDITNQLLKNGGRAVVEVR